MLQKFSTRSTAAILMWLSLWAVAPKAFAADNLTADLSLYDKKQIECLAQNIYFEARNQSDAGKAAVTHVVMNRTKSTKFPSTPCGVVKQRRGNQCQFIWVCRRNNVISDQRSYQKSIGIALKVYYNTLKDNTFGATFYHTKYVRPNWSRIFQYTVKIGDHLFYKA